jgi:hypothetical protein
MKSWQVLSTSSSLNSTSGGSSFASAPATAAPSMAASAILMATCALLASSSYLAMKSDLLLALGTGVWGRRALCGRGGESDGDEEGFGGAVSLGLKAAPAPLLRRLTTPANSLTKAGTCSSTSLLFLKKAGDATVSAFFLSVTLSVPPPLPLPLLPPVAAALVLSAKLGKIGGLVADDADAGLTTRLPGLVPPFIATAAAAALAVESIMSVELSAVVLGLLALLLL